MDVGSFIEQSNRAASGEDVFCLLRQFVGDMGFDRAIFGGATNDMQFRDRYAIKVPAPIIINNYPMDWTRHYLEHNYVQIDPIISLMPRSWGPLIWDDIPQQHHLTRAQTRMMRESREAGLLNGISLPMRGPEGETFVLSLSSSQKDGGDPHHHMQTLRVAMAQFFFAFTDHCRTPPVIETTPLTKRETECLAWSARGKSQWEISVILHISEATVRFHIGNAIAKMGTNTRIAAIVRALRWGLITL